MSSVPTLSVASMQVTANSTNPSESSKAPKHNTRVEIKSLTGLRFIAAFYVFLFHINLRWPISNNQTFNAFIGQGAVGMTLFFMLSGFVLAYQYTDEVVNYRTYFKNRLARIYPIYALAAILTLPALGLPVSLGGSFNDLLTQAEKIALLVGANILLVQAWIPQFFSYWNDGGSWSISAEAFFYLLFPLLLPFFRNLNRKYLCLTMALVYGLSLLPGAAYMLFDRTACQAIYYSLPIFRLPEFILGVCAYLLAKQISPAASAWLKLAQYASIALLIGWLATAGSGLPLYITNDFLVEPVIMIALIGLFRCDSLLRSLLSSRLFTIAGKSSYCFYSFQPVFILALMQNHDYLTARIPILKENALICIAVFAGLMLTSLASHYWIEEPARRYIKNLNW